MASELDTFYKSGLHGEDWPKQVLALYVSSQRSDSARISVYSNDRETRQHAEELLLASMLRHVRNLTPGCLQITVFQNYSPCSACSERYLKFIELLENIGFTLKLTIIFVALYKIARPSCEDRECTHKKPSPYKEREHLQGLLKLKNEGVELRSFQGRNDWLTLRKLLGLSNLPYNMSSRYAEDSLTQDDVRQKLYDAWSPQPIMQNGWVERKPMHVEQLPSTGYRQSNMQNERFERKPEQVSIEVPRPTTEVVINMPSREGRKTKSLCERLHHSVDQGLRGSGNIRACLLQVCLWV